MLSTVSIGQNVTSSISDLGGFTANIAELMLIIAGVLTFIYLVYGGILWTMSGGEPDKVESARGKITHALIGLAIVASAWAIFSLVDNFLGIGVAGKQTTNSPYTPPSNPGPGVCIYPTSRCCNAANDSSCFCDPPYNAVSLGTCNAGGGETGARCQCQLK